MITQIQWKSNAKYTYNNIGLLSKVLRRELINKNSCVILLVKLLRMSSQNMVKCLICWLVSNLDIDYEETSSDYDSFFGLLETRDKRSQGNQLA